MYGLLLAMDRLTWTTLQLQLALESIGLERLVTLDARRGSRGQVDLGAQLHRPPADPDARHIRSQRLIVARQSASCSPHLV